MINLEHDKKYWEERYFKNEASWDIGCISSPLKEYIKQLTDKEIKILIPGCGYAHEAQYLHEQGFKNVFVIDLVKKVLDSLHERTTNFPPQHLILGNYFKHEGQYDLILEQTFFSSIKTQFRPAYAKKTYDLLYPGGKLSGVLFDFELDAGPPYGGTRSEYEGYFKKLFNIKTLQRCYNSIKSRQDIEFFVIFERISNKK